MKSLHGGRGEDRRQVQVAERFRFAERAGHFLTFSLGTDSLEAAGPAASVAIGCEVSPAEECGGCAMGTWLAAVRRSTALARLLQAASALAAAEAAAAVTAEPLGVRRGANSVASKIGDHLPDHLIGGDLDRTQMRQSAAAAVAGAADGCGRMSADTRRLRNSL